jgi:hypothetical protein
MTIFRGPGGGGNANTDAEINALTAISAQATASALVAANAATAASGSASTASTSASTATTGASTATTQATTATTQAGIATTQATNAAASAVSANSSAVSVAALLANPVFTGVPTAPTAAVNNNTTQIATTAFVVAEITSKTANTALTGVPTAPTAAINNSTTQLATTAFVNAEISNDAVLKTGPTGSGQLPTGTSGQRDGAPALGYVRYNSTLNQYEGYGSGGWAALGGGATGAPGNGVFVETDQTVTGDYTLTAGKNAMTAGPITINTGVTVTVPTGATWTIV